MTTRIILAILLLASATAQEGSTSSETPENFLSTAQIWGFGLLASIAISLIGFFAAGVLILIKKLGNQTCFEYVVKFLFALACGALLGDVMVHILPESYESESTHASYIALTFICSLAFFLILERSFTACGVAHSHWVDHEEGTQEQNGDSKNSNPEMVASSQKQTSSQDEAKPESKQKMIAIKAPQNKENSEGTNQKIVEVQEAQEKDENCLSALKGKGSAGYLNLVGSLIHNFIDGFALGVAFSTGNPEEFAPLLIAIVAHEIPREMGDVAILMKSNFSETQTICCNGMINLFAIVGAIIGLAVQNLAEGTKLYILVFVAGNFIFVAADIWQHLLKNKGPFGNILECFGFALGVSIMFALLLLEG